MAIILRDALGSVLGESGFLVPTAFVGSGAPDDLQLVYLANRAVAFLREKNFQTLIVRQTTTLTSATTYALPTDYQEIVPDTMRIVGRIDTANFPTSASYWNYLKGMAGPVGIPVNVRLIGDLINVYSPEVGAVLAYEYISNCPILTDGTLTPKKKFTADTDIWRLDDDLLILEIRWRWLQAKGLPDWQLVEAECRAYRNSVMGRESGSQTILQGDDWYSGEPFTPLWVE